MKNLKKFYDAANVAEARVQAIAHKINELFDQGLVEEGVAMREDLEKAKAEAKAANELYLSMREIEEGGEPVAAGLLKPEDALAVKDMRSSAEYGKQFFEALRVGATPKSVVEGRHSAERFGLLLNAISTTGGSPAGEEGGFLLPIEFDGMIHTKMRSFINLADYVTDEPVNAYSGWRTYEVGKAASAFSALTELAVLADNAETESPVFEKVEYTIIDYGGFLRVARSTLADTPASIMNYLSNWFGMKAVLTYNSLILAKMNALTPTAISDAKNLFPGIKTALNKTLDPSISAMASIFVNQSAFDKLDQLVDGTGRPLLQPDPVNATQFRLSGRSVVMLSDGHWANLSGPSRARIAIGSASQFIAHFRREGFEMQSTDVGGSAWRSNSVEVKGILRSDVEVIDSAAMCLLTMAL